MIVFHRCLIALSLVYLGATCCVADDVDFDRYIRPLISENCVFCHGPDEEERQAGLRLDTREGALSVIEPGDPDSSELYLRMIAHEDPDILMPPPDSNRRVSSDQIKLVARWIEEGASWAQHWSFRPITSPPVPKVGWDFPVHNPIDAFVQAELQKQGMQPMPEADRATLIRRLSLDLRGLPPSPAEVAAFVQSKDPDAYAKLVQTMLDSPAYGQRMAWEWLDAARYADTNGYQGDRERTMWPWRDWVVRSFNENLPYDEFTIQQLAGDLLPDATSEQKLATGFCRNHMINGEGGRIADENRVEYVMDMTETMGTVWMGLTLNCCRCHDHKYDPITNEEYYQLFAYFNQTPVSGGGGDPQTAPNMPVPSPDQAVLLATLKGQLKELDQQLKARSQELSKEQTAWEQLQIDKHASSSQWEVLSPVKVTASGQSIRTLDDQSILTHGDNPKNDTYTVVTGVGKRNRISGIRLEALRHESMTAGGLARSNSGNFVLTGLEVSLIQTDGNRVPMSIVAGYATFEQGSLRVSNVYDNDPRSGWAVYEGRPVDRDHSAVFVLKDGGVQVPTDGKLEFKLQHDSIHANHNLGRFRLSVTAEPNPSLEDNAGKLLADLNVARESRDKPTQERIRNAHQRSDHAHQQLAKRRAEVAKRIENVQRSVPKVMVMQDLKKKRQTFVLDRGLYNKPQGEVSAGLPSFLPPSADSQSSWSKSRLELAKWLVSDDNPLTARVTVNRFWQQIFGIGLVKTPEDFGRQGEIPVHRELLNWLSADFRENGWNVKELLRKIVTSHTYRQSSKILSADVFEQDPDNRLLARGARYRLPSWMLRDQALFASGLMSPEVGGPSVNTYQPPGIWEEASFGKKKYRQDSGEKLYRRSLYVFWRRIVAPTMMFDAASRQTCVVKPNRTNTPLQALQLLNEVTYVEASRTLAQHVLKAGFESDRQRLNEVTRRILCRNASLVETQVLLAGLNRTRKQFDLSPESAGDLLEVGESSRDQELDAVEHASWTAVCLAIFNLDETLNRE